MIPCVKVLGADFELSNSLETGRHRDGPGEAARRLLDEISGFPRERGWGTVIEWGRRFLPGNGGSAYIDSDHLEMNLPEHTRAADHAAHIHAALRIARDAQVKATQKLPGTGRIHVNASVSDGHQSWGHHLNVMVQRELFTDIFTRKPYLAGFLATHQVTSLLYTGHGQVGAANDRPACDYQLSQRADWFEEFVGIQTTHRRPLLNLRDESHARDGLARMHIIFYDNVLSPIANYLKAGTTQLILAMCEAGWADPTLQLDDPLEAALRVSRDLGLKQTLTMAGRGRAWTALEVQKALCDLAGEFVASGQADDVVPGAVDIVTCWRETLELLAHRDYATLARRCDWALKFVLLERQRSRRGLTWQSPEIKVLDFLFSSLDPKEGLFWQMAETGFLDRMPSSDQVDGFVHQPPDDTRAYLRAHVLRRFGPAVISMDWDNIRFRLQTDRYWWSETALQMPDPTGFRRAETEDALQRCQTLNELMEALAVVSPPPLQVQHGSGCRAEAWGQTWDGYDGSKKSKRGNGYSVW